MISLPKDNQTARNAYYGDPGAGQIPAQLVPVVPPFAMYYTDENGRKKIKSIMFHRKAAPALLAALNEIWDYCGHDQAKVDASGASNYNGAYNHRMVRGSATKWSNHAYGTAIDLNADENALGVKGNMPQFIVDAFCRQGWMWGGWYNSRPDWMHFEAVDNGGRMPKSKPPQFAAVAHMFDAGMAVPPAEQFEDATEDATDDHEVEAPPLPPTVASAVDNTVNAKGINVQPATAVYNVDVEILQRKLVGLNYFIEVDGLWGGKTIGAVTAFMSDRGVPISMPVTFTSAVSAELNKAIAEKWSRPIAPERANATAADVAPKVEVVRQTLVQRMWAKIAAGFAALGLTGSSITSYFDAAKAKFQPVHDFLTTIPPEVWFLVVGAVAGLAWFSATRATNAAVADFNKGKIT